MQNTQLVAVGAVNWVHPGWCGAFYPPDLPQDWMLSYYNTQFQAVYLPAADWQSVSEATWAQWLNDTQDGFCFVLEPAATDAPPPPLDRVMLAVPAWAHDHVWWLDDAPDLRALAQRITRHAETGKPLYIFSRSGDIGLMEQVNALKQVMGY